MSKWKIASYKELAQILKNNGVGKKVSFAKCFEVQGNGCIDPDSVKNHYGAVLLNHFCVNYLLISQYGINGNFATYAYDEHQSIESSLRDFFTTYGFDKNRICVDVTVNGQKEQESYHSDDELCKCAYCNTHIPWGGADMARGSIWSCEECGDCFCEACFKEKHDKRIAHEMFSMDGAIDDIKCPGCYSKQTITIVKDLSERICKRCGSSVFLSELPQYAFDCRICDEDLFIFETEIRQPPKVEGTTKDTGFLDVNHNDESCPYCEEITYNLPNSKVSKCAHCYAEIFPCAGCEEVLDGCCTWNQAELRCDRFNRSEAEITRLKIEELAFHKDKLFELEAKYEKYAGVPIQKLNMESRRMLVALSEQIALEKQQIKKLKWYLSALPTTSISISTPTTTSIKIPTPFGKLTAEVTSDPAYPGIAVYLDEDEGLKDLVMVEVMPDHPEEGRKSLRAIVWGDASNEDYTHSIYFGAINTAEDSKNEPENA